MLKKLLFLSIILLAANGAFAQNKSVYTLTNEKACKPTKESSDEGYVGLCPGVGGYKLILSEGDLRQNIEVVTPSKKEFDLNLWAFYSSFSSVGERIEWRVKGKVPVALIIRFNVADVEDSTKTTSYLMVAKVSKTSACITDVVEPSKSQNVLARGLADKASSKPCKQP